MQGLQLGIGKAIVHGRRKSTSSCIAYSCAILRFCLSANIVWVSISMSEAANLMAGGMEVAEAQRILPQLSSWKEGGASWMTYS